MNASKRQRAWMIVLAAIFAISFNTAHAQLQPIVIGGGDIPDNSGPSACERDFDKDGADIWFGKMIHTLCQRRDADSLFAVYLFTMDTRVLKEAYSQNKSNPALLWAVTTQTECTGPLQGCKSAKIAVEAAQALTSIDPDNAMAWFALARAEDMVMTEPDKVDSALEQAAKASRAHDYSFDLTKLAEKAIAGISAPTDAEAEAWQHVGMTMMLGYRFGVWAGHCSFLTDEGDPDRKKLCEAAKEQFKHGDSLLTLSGDAEAKAKMDAATQKPAGVSENEYAKIMLEAIRDSTSEREWREKIAARLKTAATKSQ